MGAGFTDISLVCGLNDRRKAPCDKLRQHSGRRFCYKLPDLRPLFSGDASNEGSISTRRRSDAQDFRAGIRGTAIAAAALVAGVASFTLQAAPAAVP